MPRWLFWRTGLGKDGRKERNHFLWNTICSESSKPTRLSTYQLVSFNLCYLSPLIGEWKYFRRVSSTIMSASTHNNILGVTLSGDFGDVCTLSDLRPNHSWATPHKISLCLAGPPLPKKLIRIFLFLVSSQVLKAMWSCGREFVQRDLNNMECSWNSGWPLIELIWLQFIFQFLWRSFQNCLSPKYWQSRGGCGCPSLIGQELAKPSIWTNQRPAFTSCFVRAVLNSQNSWVELHRSESTDV